MPESSRRRCGVSSRATEAWAGRARAGRSAGRSADAYAAFEETAASDGTASVETGARYRQAILESGGSRPAMESFKAFRGREPSLDALLRHQGMSA